MLQPNHSECYARAVQGGNIGLWCFEIKKNHLFLSSFLKTILGYEKYEGPEQLTEFEKHIYPDDLPKLTYLIHQRLDVNLVYRLKTKTGDYHWFHMVGKAFVSQEQTLIAGSMIDIDIYKKAELRLAAQYAATRVLSEASDLKEATEKILEAICKHLEWQFGSIWMIEEDVHLINCIGTWHQPKLNAQAFEKVTQTIQFPPGVGLPGRVWLSGKPTWIVDVVVDPNFPRAPQAKEADLHSAFCFPILKQNKVLGVIEFFTRLKQTPDKPLLNMMAAIGPQLGEFIQRKRIEAKLRESEAHKTAILQSANDSIMTIYDTGQIMSFNPITLKTFGYTAEELQNKNIDSLIPYLSEKISEFVGKAMIELTGIRKNGEAFPIELTISETQLKKQRLFVNIIIIRDITERKKIDTMKSEFISIVSHELRTPLTSIKGAIGLLINQFGHEFSDKSHPLLEIANKNCERLIRLINDILDVEKIEAGKMVFKFDRVNLSNLIHDAVNINEAYAKKFDVSIRIVKDESAFVWGDYDRLMQVVTNLLSNAIKFSPKKSDVQIAITQNAGWVRVSVKDKGPGIPEEFQSKIFGKFLQADTSPSRKIEGSGLGLSICKAIIDNHHGNIGFTTELNQGTVFYFDLCLV